MILYGVNMVKAIVDIPERENRVVNIVKAKYGLRDKSKAITLIIKRYEEEMLEPQLRPEFIREMKKRRKEKTVKIGTIKDFKKRYGSK